MGCGTDRHLLKLMDVGLDVIGLDVSVDMLSEAVAKIRDTASAHASFIQCDGEHLPLRNGDVHSIICSLTFGHFARTGMAIGGIVGIIVGIALVELWRFKYPRAQIST